MVQAFFTLLSLFLCVNSALIPVPSLSRDNPSPAIAPAPSIPSCAIPCIASAVAQEITCGATDLVCQCDPDNVNLIQGLATSCVLQACGIEEALQVLNDTTAECSSVLAAVNASAAPSSAAPSAIPSVIPTSAPASIPAAPSSVPTTSPIDSSPPSAVPSSVVGSVPSAVPTSPNATFVIPACADSCIQNAVGLTSCGLTNITCQCEKSNAEAIQSATVSCVTANCGENGANIAIEIDRSQVDNCTAPSAPAGSSSSITGSVTANGPTQISLTGNPSGISTEIPPCGPPIPYYGYPTQSNPINPPGSPTSGAGDPSGIVSSTPTDPGSASSTNASVDPSGGSGSISTDPSFPTSGGSFPSGAGSSTTTDPGSASSTNISLNPSGIVPSTPTDPGSASSTNASLDPSGGSGSISTDPSSPTSSNSFPSDGPTPVDPGSASSTYASVDPSGSSGSSQTIPGSFPSSSSPSPADPSGGTDPSGAASSTYPSDPSGPSSTPPGGVSSGPSYSYGYGYGTYYPSSTPTSPGNGGDPSDPSGSGGASVSSSATGPVSQSSQSISAPSTSSGGDSSSPSTSGGDPSSPGTTGEGPSPSTTSGGDSSSPSTTGGGASSPSTTNSNTSSPTTSSGLNNPSSLPTGTDPSPSSPSNSKNPPRPPPPSASGGYYGYNPASVPAAPSFTSPSTPAIPTPPSDSNSPFFRLSLLPSRYSLLEYIIHVYFNFSPPSPFISSRGLTTNSRTSACLFSISSSGLLSCSGSSSFNSHSHTGSPNSTTEDAKTRYFGDEFARVWDSGYTVLQTRNTLRDMHGKDLNGTLVVDSTSEYPYGSLLKLRNEEFIGNDNQARFCAQTSSPIPSTYGSPNSAATQSQTDAFLEGSPVRVYINGTQGLPADCQEVKLVIEWVDDGGF
ncbi:hypothetical protein BOTCAL_0372g00100 [Botryotinia calthae]|uniref:CFEM domain-containing protein n=1 Tax=Botryotinia calthae TaxID=38488 RepID=A0A4Y8CRV1_9HELO|nr:hypothetical protein BOTCAL_0372g00100 [Botryotinia calthae]